MSKMSELAAELEAMSFAELEEAHEALKFCQSKGIRDEFMQEAYAQELNRRETMWKEITV